MPFYYENEQQETAYYPSCVEDVCETQGKSRERHEADKMQSSDNPVLSLFIDH